MLARRPPTSSGFTLVELVVVISVIGMLSLFALPRYRGAVEKARVSQALSFLAQVQSSQERHGIEHGNYADQLNQLDVDYQIPLGFEVQSMSASTADGQWRLILERHGASSGYGRYNLQWTENGFDPLHSSLPEGLYPAGISRNLLLRSQGVLGNSR